MKNYIDIEQIAINDMVNQIMFENKIDRDKIKIVKIKDGYQFKW